MIKPHKAIEGILSVIDDYETGRESAREIYEALQEIVENDYKHGIEDPFATGFLMHQKKIFACMDEFVKYCRQHTEPGYTA